MDESLIVSSDLQISDSKNIALLNKINEIINILNLKVNGIYSTLEFDTGKLYFPSPNISSIDNQQVLPRNVYGRVVNFGALPSSTTKTVAHGININPELIFIDIYGCATNTGVGGKKLPYASPVLNDNIEIWPDATYVNIKTAKDYSAYTVCYVVIEYIKI